MKHWNVFFRMRNAFVQHYSNVKHDRSAAQVERENWLLPGMIPFNRYMLLPCAILSQTCVGSLDAWSGFNLPIEAQLYGLNGGVDRSMSANVFYVMGVFFAMSAAIAGPWLERTGPSRGLFIGASIFFFGNLLTALGVYVKQLPVIYIGYGVAGGIGMGISFVCPVSPLQRWFPEKRGVASGLAVCGMSIGTIVFPFIQKASIGEKTYKTGEANLGIELTFVILGSCSFVIMSVCALILRQPPPGYSAQVIQPEIVETATDRSSRVVVVIPVDAFHMRPRSNQLTTVDSTSSILPKLETTAAANKANIEDCAAVVTENCSAAVSVPPGFFAMTSVQVLSSVPYWMTYLTFLGAEMTGLLISSKIQSIVQNQLGRSSGDGAMVNALLGGFDLLGRLVLPFISDLINTRKPLYALSLLCQLICLSCLPSVMCAKSFGGLLACASIIAFFFGGGFGMIAAFLADQFGPKNVGAANGVMMTSIAVIAFVGGMTFSAVYKAQKAVYLDEPARWYDLDFRWMLGPVLLALITCLFIPTDLRLRRLPKTEKELLRFRFVNGRMVRIARWKVSVISAQQEEEEWSLFLGLRTLCPQGLQQWKKDGEDAATKASNNITSNS